MCTAPLMVMCVATHVQLSAHRVTINSMIMMCLHLWVEYHLRTSPQHWSVSGASDGQGIQQVC